MHKNTHLKNKWLFINNFKEVLGKNSLGEPEKIMYIVEGTDVFDYKNYVVYLKFSAQLKFNSILQIKKLNVSISDLEMRDTEKNIKYNLLQNPFYNLYQTFKSFINELRSLVMDLEFLNDY